MIKNYFNNTSHSFSLLITGFIGGIVIYPLLLSAFMFYMGYSSDLAYRSVVNYLCIFFDALLFLSLFKSTVNHSDINKSILFTMIFGTAWCLAGWYLENISYAMLVLLFLNLTLCYKDPRNVFRWSMVLMVFTTLIIGAIHHKDIIYGAYNNENLKIDAALKEAVSQENSDWSNEKCKSKDIIIDSCMRFPDKYFEQSVNYEEVLSIANKMRERYKESKQIQVEQVRVDIDLAPSWALSFDGQYWQVAYKENYYYQYIEVPLLSWLWYWASIVWSITFLWIANFHQERNKHERIKSHKDIAMFLIGVLAIHIAHMLILASGIRWIFFMPPDLHLLHTTNLYMQTETWLYQLVSVSVLGWLFLILVVFLLHLPLILTKKSMVNTDHCK